MLRLNYVVAGFMCLSMKPSYQNKQGSKVGISFKAYQYTLPLMFDLNLANRVVPALMYHSTASHLSLRDCLSSYLLWVYHEERVNISLWYTI